ncbi:hypothetical protein ACFOY2_42435 [Nonomuraea purpurea]|uniref:Uncharacterized protein n=1 Tax=Nonomuraea purpurea TaxID=1849276 RepID=A0ABV8GLX9_9ACTN
MGIAKIFKKDEGRLAERFLIVVDLLVTATSMVVNEPESTGSVMSKDG